MRSKAASALEIVIKGYLDVLILNPRLPSKIHVGAISTSVPVIVHHSVGLELFRDS